MLLIVPTWAGGASGEVALLGFGDVVLPGLLLVYTRIFDLQYHRGLCSGYFVLASVGYGVGLILTYGALYFQLGGDQVRADLLYRPNVCPLAVAQSFVACVLFPLGLFIVILALCSRHRHGTSGLISYGNANVCKILSECFCGVQPIC